MMMGERIVPPEVLAPAGGFDALTAAVRCGADAVYFGAGAFNARMRASGFGPEDMAPAAAYCRARDVKAYLTLNTLIYDHEYGAALELVKKACEAGMDALILQDPGLTAQIRRHAPDMPLHASTQMTAHTPSGLRFLHKMGFSRAVLARELSRDELREILREAAALGMETEVFVHGALCMSVSGQCSLSAALGGRSGNRGECAQPCRLPFSAPGRPYALSLKDLCLLNHIPELVSMGVTSLKIEGRLKRPEYVAAAVCAYRRAADGEDVGEALRGSLQSVFSRGGFTDGYYAARRTPDMFGVRSEEDKTASGTVMSQIHELYRRERSAVPVDMTLTVLKDRPAALRITDGTHTVTESGPLPSPAQNAPLDAHRAQAQLAKTGGTPFFLRELRGEIGPGLSVPGAVLGALRRQALEKLLWLRQAPPVIPFILAPGPSAVSLGAGYLPQTGEVSSRGPDRGGIFREKGDARPAFWGTFRDCGQYSPDLLLERFFVPYDSPDAFFEAHCRGADKPPCGAELPRGLFGADAALATRLAELSALGVRDVLCGSIGAAQLALEAGLRPHFGTGMNLFGENALAAAGELGAVSGVLSPEVSAARAAGVRSPIPAGAAAYGHLPLMLTRSCPLRGGGCRTGGKACKGCAGHGVLKDRKGAQLPVLCFGGCAELLNPHVLWMGDRLGTLRGLDFILLKFTLETPEECVRVVRAYREGAPPPAEFTRLG